MSANPVTRPETAPSPDTAPAGAEYGHLLDLIGLVLRAPLRRRRLAAAALLLGLLASAAAVIFTPRTYVVEARILGQRNLVMPSLLNPRRSVPNESDAPTRAATDLILGRENLVAIMKEADLVARWDAERPPVLRLKDRAVEAVIGPLSPEDRERAMIGVLEKKLRVQHNESTIRISIEWSNPRTAYDIVAAAQKSFLSHKSDIEVSVIADTIGILTVEAERHRETLDSAFTRVVKLYRQELAAAETEAAAARTDAAPAPAPPRAVQPRPVVVEVPAASQMPAALLAEKRRAIRQLEEPRQRRLADLEARRVRLLLTYTEAHPEVRALDAEIQAQRVEPPELVALRREEAELADKIAGIGSVTTRRTVYLAPRAAAPASAPAAPAAAAAAAAEPREESPELEAARGKLAIATRRYEDLMDRIDSAQIELYTAQAAFKYRYTILEPPEVPKEADRPRTAVLVVGGLALSVLLAFFAAAAADLAGGRFVEAWQVRRRLRVPVLAEVEQP